MGIIGKALWIPVLDVDITVRLYGYPSSSIKVDGTTTYSLNGSGYYDITISTGTHTFLDNYTSTTKTFTLDKNSTEVPCGIYFGGTGTKTLPTGSYSKIRGTRYGTVSQSGRSGSTQNIWPACRRSQSVSCSGAKSATLASGNIATLPYDGKTYQKSRTSGEKTSAFNVSVGSFTGGSLTISTSGSHSQDSGNAYVNVSGSGGVRYVYVY